jgi:hypothetical protein
MKAVKKKKKKRKKKTKQQQSPPSTPEYSVPNIKYLNLLESSMNTVYVCVILMYFIGL